MSERMRDVLVREGRVYIKWRACWLCPCIVVTARISSRNDIEPYLAYTDRVRDCVKGGRVIFDMDANAASPL